MKSHIALQIIKELKPSSILLLTNSGNLRDTNWYNEFIKFGMEDVWNELVTSECYQTVYKYNGTHYDLVIADEIDASLSPAYSRYYTNNTWSNLLGLTGFCTEEKRKLLDVIAPVCYEVSTQELQDQGLLNKSEFIFVEFDLDIAGNIKIPKKAGGYFMTSENDQYKYYDMEFTKAMIVKSKAEAHHKLFPVEESKLKSADFKFKMMAAKRKAILNNLNSSVKVVQNIVTEIHRTTNNKVLIFSALTKQADKLGYLTYHGDADSEVLTNFNLGITAPTLCVCKKLNRGVNLTGLNYTIKESFDGSETDFQQQHGRSMRLRPDQTAKIIVLVPYYKALVKHESTGLLGQTVVTNKMMRLPTQAKKWADKMMASFKEVNGRTIVMTKEYKLPEGASL